MKKIPEWTQTLRKWREDLGLTQKAAAAVLECGERRIQGIEAGESNYKLTRPTRVFMAVYYESKAQNDFK
jgi:predicted transcriptional regulator